jgi:acetylglutamate kinase
VDGVRVGEGAVPELDAEEARRRIDDGTIAGGMALKVRVALEAAAAGIPEVVVAGRARLVGGFPGTRIRSTSRAEAMA